VGAAGAERRAQALGEHAPVALCSGRLERALLEPHRELVLEPAVEHLAHRERLGLDVGAILDALHVVGEVLVGLLPLREGLRFDSAGHAPAGVVALAAVLRRPRDDPAFHWSFLSVISAVLLFSRSTGQTASSRRRLDARRNAPPSARRPSATGCHAIPRLSPSEASRCLAPPVDPARSRS